MPRVLLTTVFRPFGGPDQGPSMGVDVMKGQLCVNQGALRTSGTGAAYGLEYLAANLASPTTVLHWPSAAELVRELRKGPDVVGITFTFQLTPRMRETVALVRRHAPGARVVIGGYGTAAPETAHDADEVCTGEGIAWMRDLLGERVGEPIEHPTLVYGNRVLSLPVQAGRKVIVCTGLGCATGCDFCATSAKFKRSYLPFVADGDALFRLLCDLSDRAGTDEFQVLDENFLVHEERARRLADLCVQHDRHFDFFTFASLRSLARWSAEDLVRVGISAVWVGLEGKKAGYDKLHGEDLRTLVARLRAAGILVVGSMIVGFDYHTPQIVREELEEIVAAGPTYLQCLVYGPTPGTALYQRLDAEGRWRGGPPGEGVPYGRCDGYILGFRHSNLSVQEVEVLQRHCLDRDLQAGGPSMYRAIETWMEGWSNLRSRPEPFLRARARVYEKKLRGCRPLLPVGIARAPNPDVRARLEDLQRRMDRDLGPQTVRDRVAGRVILPAAAAWTQFALDHDLFQEPRLIRTTWRGAA